MPRATPLHVIAWAGHCRFAQRVDMGAGSADIESPSVSGIVRSKQQHAAVEQVEHDLGACVARSGI